MHPIAHLLVLVNPSQVDGERMDVDMGDSHGPSISDMALACRVPSQVGKGRTGLSYV